MALQRIVPTLVIGLLMATLAAAAEPGVIYLRNGSVIQGDILRRGPDRIIVDLGFTVVSVPRDEIDRIVESESVGPAEPGARNQQDLYREAPGQSELTVKENLIRCGESIVEIRTPTGLGSGFLISPQGHVVTADHVIAGENKLSITLFRRAADGLDKVQLHDIEILATDPYGDLALLKIRDTGSGPFPSLPLGNSDAIRQGQAVFAVGSPLGFERSVSQGIVSLRNRPIGGRLLIQSTAQLNPCNSGGPLLDLRGQVVGVNNLKIIATGVEGLSFSVPVNALKRFLRNLDAFAFDPRNPNAGFRYMDPPRPGPPPDLDTDGD